MAVHPIDYRYGSREMREIFEEETRLQLMLDVEAALSRAHADLNHIPKEAAEEISKKANTRIVKIERVKEIEEETKHDIMAMVKALAEKCKYGGYVHLGATSNDINDTATALQFKMALNIVLEDLEELKEILKRLTEENIDRVCIGRTHGQHSIPTTYGMKLGIFLDETKRNIERIKRAKENIRGKMSGAVGTMASFDDGINIQKLVGKYLNIKMAEISNQIVQRDIYAEIICSLAILASTLDKIALEIRNLQRTEIMEIAEAFGKKQVGSSTMPHKRNPITSEKICGLARVIYSNVFPALLNNPLWHERDLTNSSCERVIIPETFVLIDEMLKGMKKTLENIVFYPENIEKNLELLKGRNMAEAVMIKLVKKGYDRQKAHELLRIIAQKEGDFKENLIKNETVRKYLTEREIEEALNPERYIGSAVEIVRGVLKED
ncbi:MAG TPA: adenylosuccinate lyase [Methanomicrobia archaeon]|nr:adenylosuccinate lyase [Methanomicrobia archaeon]